MLRECRPNSPDDANFPRVKHIERSPPRSRKRFGQNFLTDRNTIDRIVRAIGPRVDDHIVEIGPGHGELTGELLKSGCQLQVIEIDRDLIADLRIRFPGLPITECDVLKHDFSDMARSARGAGKQLRIVGNLPYNISTPLLFKLFQSLEDIADLHFMLQLEVVDRIVAKPSSSNYGRLSVMAQYWCDATKLFAVSAAAFNPRPKVMSAVVRLVPRVTGPRAHNVALLEKLVTAAFSQRRKTIRNGLRSFLSAEDLAGLSLDPGLRPENLSVADFVSCANYVGGRKGDA